jgi:hypothetical protein
MKVLYVGQEMAQTRVWDENLNLFLNVYRPIGAAVLAPVRVDSSKESPSSCSLTGFPVENKSFCH